MERVERAIEAGKSPDPADVKGVPEEFLAWLQKKWGQGFAELAMDEDNPVGEFFMGKPGLEPTDPNRPASGGLLKGSSGYQSILKKRVADATVETNRAKQKRVEAERAEEAIRAAGGLDPMVRQLLLEGLGIDPTAMGGAVLEEPSAPPPDPTARFSGGSTPIPPDQYGSNDMPPETSEPDEEPTDEETEQMAAEFKARFEADPGADLELVWSQMNLKWGSKFNAIGQAMAEAMQRGDAAPR